MAQILNMPEAYESGIEGAAPNIWFGKSAPDGDRGPWNVAPIGSIYVQKSSTSAVKTYRKVKVDGADNDWIQWQGGVVAETVTRADFTDGGAAAGTVTLGQSIPVGAVVLRSLIRDVTGFTGDTSAVITIGDGTDVDRYNTGTPNVFVTATDIDAGAVSGTAFHAAAIAPVLTITSAVDFTAVTAGQLTVYILYLD